ncbi:unnamed protein product, partial [Oncorhynchus mykiss]
MNGSLLTPPSPRAANSSPLPLSPSPSPSPPSPSLLPMFPRPPPLPPPLAQPHPSSLSDTPTPSPCLSWTEFCELHARMAAGDFARHFRAFLLENPHYSPDSAAAFCRRFTDRFVRHFQSELEGVAGALGTAPGMEAGSWAPQSDATSLEEEAVSPPPVTEGASYHPCAPANPVRALPKPASTRLSKTKLKKRFSLRSVGRSVRGSVRGILHWRSSSSDSPQSSSQLPSSYSYTMGRNSGTQPPTPTSSMPARDRRRSNGEGGEKEKWSHRLEKLRLSRSPPPVLSSAPTSAVVSPSSGLPPSSSSSATPRKTGRLVREGGVSVSSSMPDEGGRWHKCRLVLRERDKEGERGEEYYLEFFIPPKSSKPRLTIPCCSIVDVRSTTALEVPDKENTFLLQVMLCSVHPLISPFFKFSSSCCICRLTCISLSLSHLSLSPSLS